MSMKQFWPEPTGSNQCPTINDQFVRQWKLYYPGLCIIDAQIPNYSTSSTNRMCQHNFFIFFCEYEYDIISIWHTLHTFCLHWYQGQSVQLCEPYCSILLCLLAYLSPTVWICRTFVPIVWNILKIHTIGLTGHAISIFKITWGAGSLHPLRPVLSNVWKKLCYLYISCLIHSCSCLQECEAKFSEIQARYSASE
jgi:hypothetical protein